MKAKVVGKRIAAGLMTMSLLLSNLPVTAAADAAQQEHEEAGEDADSAAGGDADAGSRKLPEGREGSADEQAASEGAQTKADEQAASESTQVKADEQAASESTQVNTDAQDSSERTQVNTDEQAASESTRTNADAQDSSERAQTNADAQDTSEGEQVPADAQDRSEGRETPADVDEEVPEKEAETDSEKAPEADPEEEAVEEEPSPQEFFLENLKSVDGAITIDGDLSDWANVTAHGSGKSGIDEWKAALSADGAFLYFAYTGTAGTEWDYTFASYENAFVFGYADQSRDRDSAVSITAWKDGASVKDAYNGDIAGAEVMVVNEAHHNNAGPYTAEFAVPVSFFHSSDFTLTFAGETIDAQDLEQVNGAALDPPAPPVYAGITIDGSYSDWAALARTEVSCPNAGHPDCVSEAAAVYDGDWLYIYIKDGPDGNASNAGTRSNGKFAILSDLNYETDIQLSTAPAVSGVDGAKVAYVGREWEIAIPRDQLPKYRESLSFAFYLGDPIIENIVNLQEDSGNNLDTIFNGVVCDGEYQDWEDYGHTTIEYDTPGSQEQHIDAKGALYSTGEKLYGHAVTDAPDHLAEAGGEFIKGVTIAFNQKLGDLQSGAIDRNQTFFCKFVTVDAAGNIHWNPQQEGYAEGTYKFAIASIDAWTVSTNISDLHEMDQLYGEMYMTIGKGGKDEMEFCLDLPMAAKKFGLDKTDLKQIAAQFIRIGHQWVCTAGASTGPAAGVALCLTTVGLVFWRRRRKGDAAEWVPAGA